MALNPNIILSGAQPNFVNALSQGAAAAQMTNQVQQENGLRNLYRDQGAGIAAGDQNALNALAGFSPEASLGIQGQRQAIEVDQARLTNIAQDSQIQAAKWAQAQDAAALAGKEAELSDTLIQMNSFYDAQDPQGLEGFAVANGFKPGEVTLQNFPEYAAQSAGVIKAIEDANSLRNPEPPKDPAAVQALKFRAEAAGLVDGTPAYSQFMLDGGKQATGFRVESSPDGFVVEQGAGVNTAASGPEVPKLTVDAAKNAGFLIRTNEANGILSGDAESGIEPLDILGLQFGQQNLEKVPLGLGNYFRSEEFQQFDQARRNFVNAILRRESGAVISDAEFENANIQYFPVPGDDEAVIAQKRQNRLDAISGLRVGSGKGAAYVDQLSSSGSPPDVSAMTEAQLGQLDIEGMSDAELDAVEARFKELSGG